VGGNNLRNVSLIELCKVAGAMIWLGAQSVLTDANGQFSFARADFQRR
jgi:hypothetical protein